MPAAAAFVVSRAGLAAGLPYGPGLAGLGLDPERLLVVSAENDRDALWAIEEILRARALPGVLGWLGGGLSLKPGQRLQRAAEGSAALLLVLRPAGAEAANAAATRWRVAAAPAGLDRFGSFAAWRWQVALERCRNGRTGRWTLEWNHDAHRLGLVEDGASMRGRRDEEGSHDAHRLGLVGGR